MNKLKYALMFVFLFVVAAPAYSNQTSEVNSNLQAQKPTFEAWLAAFRQEALVKGIPKNTVEKALANIKLIKRVVVQDRNQPEFKLTFQQYLDRVAPASRVTRGRNLLKHNEKLLAQIEKAFGVQPRFIVALWGIESDFGRLTGGYNVLDALATLAYDGRRGDFFRNQLLNALRIIDYAHVEPQDMTGSWAGAMGQTQFMPSTFLAHAVDFNRDGKIDIWTTTADALASGSNYLSKVGWRDDETWGREVRLPKGFDKSLADLKIQKKISQWQALGVRKADGSHLPTRDLMASIVIMDDGEGPAYMVYNNFRAIMDWNKSINFATSVGILSDRIAN